MMTQELVTSKLIRIAQDLMKDPRGIRHVTEGEIKAMAAIVLDALQSTNPPELTPEVVLRAMLVAYQDAQLNAAVRYVSSKDADEKTVERRYMAIREQAEQVLECLASHLSGSGAYVSELIGHDYRARLAGERPLDAPPLEVTP